MALRRSSRRMTFTGSSMFSASTPMVPPVKENTNIGDGTSSPQWVSAEDAFGGIKTPKLGKMTRRTTLTRQNVFTEDTVVGTAVVNNEGFKAPRFFIPVSPPGVKTRSRRSSIFMAPPQQAKKFGNATGGKKENNAKMTRKPALKRKSEIVLTVVNEKKNVAPKLSPKKALPDQTLDGGDAEFTNIQRLSPIFDSGVKVNMKKPRRSIRHQAHSELSMETTDFIFKTPSIPLSPTGDLIKLNDSGKNFTAIITETPKVFDPFKTPGKAVPRSSKSNRKTPKSDFTSVSHESLTKFVDEDSEEEQTVKNQETTKVLPRWSPLKDSASQLSGLKRQVSKEENEEIDSVVKKMFTSSKDLTHKQKFTSPNSTKATASPARTALLRNSVKKGRKSPGRSQLNSRDTLPKTPSRAAPKARKILGVSTVSTPLNDNTQNKKRQSLQSEQKVLIIDETINSFSETEEVSFGVENDNDMTLSHTSHSQWCIIL